MIHGLVVGSVVAVDLDPLAHSHGVLHVLTSLRDILSFQSYLLRVNFIYQLKQKNIVITVGDDEDLSPLIR